MHADLNTLRELLAVDADIPGPVLVGFAGPLFELYGVPRLASCTHLRPDEVRRDEIEGAAASLEAARVFWLFFRQRGPDANEMLAKLQTVLLGESPDDEYVAVFSALVVGMVDRWNALAPSVRDVGPSPSDARRELHLLFSATSEDVQEIEERDPAVDSPDALATFAGPLLECPSVGDDPERVSEVMHRAQSYWNLAMVPPEDYNRRLSDIVQRFAGSGDERPLIESEANMMVARFHKLFPHWSRT
jgi:hypothetical protein